MDVRKISDDGIINLAEAIIERTKKDFISDAQMLYLKNGYISDKDLVRSSAYRFVRDDPYSFFTSTKDVIESWKKDAMADMYKKDYINGLVVEWMEKNGKDTKKYEAIKGKYKVAKAKVKELDREYMFKIWQPAAIHKIEHRNWPRVTS